MPHFEFHKRPPPKKEYNFESEADKFIRETNELIESLNKG